MYQLKYVTPKEIYLLGSSFEINVDQSDETVSIIMDGEYQNKEEIIIFKLSFKKTGSIYYEINELWEETLKENYDLSEMDRSNWACGVYKVENYSSSKMEEFDPKNRLNLVKFIIVGQYCFCEIIANADFEINEYQGRNNSEMS